MNFFNFYLIACFVFLFLFYCSEFLKSYLGFVDESVVGKKTTFPVLSSNFFKTLKQPN